MLAVGVIILKTFTLFEDRSFQRQNFISGDSSTLSCAIGHMKLHITLTLASHPMYMSRTRLPREYQITLAGKKHLFRGVGRQFLSLKRKALYAQIPDTKL